MRIPPDSVLFTALLGVFAALPAFSIDIRAPTLPLLPAALNTSIRVAGLTISLFMVGFALGQLGGGWQSDRWGRRPLSLLGLAAYVVAGLACAVAPNGPSLVAARFGQGLSAGVCAVISFAMVQDLFQGEAARRKRSYVVVVVGVIPIIAPAVGSVLTGLTGWRSVHAILSLLGCLLLFVTYFFVPETKCAPDPQLPDIDNGPGLRSDRTFLLLVAANALSYGGVFAFIAGTPVVVMDDMGFSSTVLSGAFACSAASLTLGAWTCAWLVRTGVSATRLLGVSLGLAAVANIALAFESFASARPAWLLLLTAAVGIYARGIISPNFQHVAIDRQGHRAGSAAAVLGVAQLLLAALASAVVSMLLPLYGASAVAVPMGLLATLALMTWLSIRGI